MADEVVYIIGTGIGSPVKIGTTKDIERRLKDFRNGAPHPYIVFRLVPGGRDMEAWFHTRFHASRIAREWFEYDAEMLTIQAPTDPFVREVDPFDKSTYVGLMVTFLRGRYGGLKNSSKLIAKDAMSNSRTAENWLAGSHAPNGERLLDLMAANPDLAEQINNLVAERRASRGEQ